MEYDNILRAVIGGFGDFSGGNGSEAVEVHLDDGHTNEKARREADVFDARRE
jgi:hypothetical protein